MLGEKHDLVHELPEHKDQIHKLKQDNKHFSRLLSRYDDLDTQIRKIEEGFESTSDDFIEALKKERLHLKDELFSIIKSA